jgi:large subunit ribosomal protein L10
MALTRAKKTQKVEALAKELAGSTSAIVGTFAKLTVAQDFALRQKVREAGGSYRVVKNKLAARASMGTGIEGALQGLKGVSSVAYTSGDPVALAKALSAWVKDNSEFSFKLGIVDGKVITVEEVQSLATMPGKSELYAKLLFLISAPAQRLVTVLSASGRDLAVVIGQGVEKGKFAEGTPAAAVPAAAAAPAAEPAAAEVVAEPVVAAEPVAAEPVAAEPVAAEPVAAEPVAAEPVAAEVASAEPVPVEMNAVAPEAAPETAESESAASPSTESSIAEPIAAAEPVAEFSAAPAPAEGPAAEGSEAEAAPTQAEEAADESPAEG